MKQIFRDEIPQSQQAELADVRFLLLKSAAFGGIIIAKGNDAIAVSRGNVEPVLNKDGTPKPPHCINPSNGQIWYGDNELYRIDER